MIKKKLYIKKKYIKGSHPKKEEEANYNWEGGKIVTYYLLPQSHYQLARIHSLSSFYSQVTSAKTKPHLFQINYQIKDLNFVGMCILQINFQNEYSVEISLVYGFCTRGGFINQLKLQQSRNSGSNDHLMQSFNHTKSVKISFLVFRLVEPK